MGRSKKEDLKDFSDWLESVRGVSPASASVYTSRVRRLLATMPVVSETALDTVLDRDDIFRYRSSYVSAWRSFILFAQGLNVTLPTPTRGTSIGRVSYTLPPSIMDDLLEIMAQGSIKTPTLADLRWCHLDPQLLGGAQLVQHPSEPGTWIRMPMRPIQRLKEWGQPQGSSPEDPWVPSEPGSSEAMPGTAIRRLLARHRRSQTPS